jgi:hypothetical protein
MIGNTIISTLKLMIFIMDRKAISQNEFTGPTKGLQSA